MRHAVDMEYDEKRDIWIASCEECEWSKESVNVNTINDYADRHEGISPTVQG